MRLPKAGVSKAGKLARQKNTLRLWVWGLGLGLNPTPWAVYDTINRSTRAQHSPSLSSSSKISLRRRDVSPRRGSESETVPMGMLAVWLLLQVRICWVDWSHVVLYHSGWRFVELCCITRYKQLRTYEPRDAPVGMRPTGLAEDHTRSRHIASSCACQLLVPLLRRLAPYFCATVFVRPAPCFCVVAEQDRLRHFQRLVSVGRTSDDDAFPLLKPLSAEDSTLSLEYGTECLMAPSALRLLLLAVMPRPPMLPPLLCECVCVRVHLLLSMHPALALRVCACIFRYAWAPATTTGGGPFIIVEWLPFKCV